MLYFLVVAVGEQKMCAQHSEILKSKTRKLVDNPLHESAGAAVRLGLSRALLDFATQLVERSEIRFVIVGEYGQDLALSPLLFLPVLLLGPALKKSLDWRCSRDQQQPELASKQQKQIRGAERQGNENHDGNEYQVRKALIDSLEIVQSVSRHQGSPPISICRTSYQHHYISYDACQPPVRLLGDIPSNMYNAFLTPLARPRSMLQKSLMLQRG